MPIRIRFVTHAQIRLLERSISVDRVRKTVIHPDIYTQTYQGRIKAQKKFEDTRILEVVYTKGYGRNENVALIITAYYI